MEETFEVEFTKSELIALASLVAYTTGEEVSELVHRNYGEGIRDQADYGLASFLAYLKLYDLLDNELGIRELDDDMFLGEF